MFNSEVKHGGYVYDGVHQLRERCWSMLLLFPASKYMTSLITHYHVTFAANLNEKQRDTCSSHAAILHNAAQVLRLIGVIKCNTVRQKV